MDHFSNPAEICSGDTSHIVSYVKESPMSPVFILIAEQLPTILRKFLMYPHKSLVSSALSLIFRLGSINSEISSLLQEVQLLQSPSRVELYREACRHAVRLQNFYNNKSNLKGKWAEVMLKEMQWFMSKLRVNPSTPTTVPPKPAQGYSLSLSQHHFERQCESVMQGTDEVMDVQDMLRSLKVHDAILKILEAEPDDSEPDEETLPPVMYGFLTAFCEDNPKNQAALCTDSSLRTFAGQLTDDVVCAAYGCSMMHSRGGYEIQAIGGTAYEFSRCW